MDQIEQIMMNRINPRKTFFCAKKMNTVNLNVCSVCKLKEKCESRISLFGNVNIKVKGGKV